GGLDQTVILWDTFTGKPRTRWKAPLGDTLLCLAFSADSRELAVGGGTGKGKVWDVVSGKELVVMDGHQWPIAAVGFLDGPTVVTVSGDKVVKVWDLAKGHEVATFPGFSSGLASVTWNENATLLAWGCDDGRIVVRPRDSREKTILKG